MRDPTPGEKIPLVIIQAKSQWDGIVMIIFGYESYIAIGKIPPTKGNNKKKETIQQNELSFAPYQQKRGLSYIHAFSDFGPDSCISKESPLQQITRTIPKRPPDFC